MEHLLFWLIAAALIVVLLAWRHVFMGLVFIKTMSFFAVVELALVAYLILLAQGRARLPRLNWINIAVALLLIVFGITAIFAVHPYVSFWGSYNRIWGLVTWLHLGALYYIVAGFLREPRDWHRLLQISIWASIPVLLYALGQYFHVSFIAPSETYRVESTIGNPVFLAGYLMVLLPITAGYAIATKGSFNRWVFGAIGLTQFIVLLLTGSRGGMVALFITILVLMIIYAILHRKRYLFWWAGLFMVVSLALAGITQWQADSPLVRNNLVLRRISEINLTQSASQTRLWAWREGIVAWTQRPLLGWGLENYSVAQNQNYKPFMEKYSIEETWFDRAHNIFVDSLVMTGIIGFLALIFLFGVILVMAWRMSTRSESEWGRAVGLIILSATTASIVFGFFAFDTISSLPYILLLWGILSSQLGREIYVGKKFWIYILVPLVLISSYPFVIRNVLANKSMSNAIVAYYKQDFEQAFKSVDRALGYNTFLNNNIRSKLLDLGYDAYSKADTIGGRAVVEPYLVRIADIAKDTVVTEPGSAFYYTRLLHLYVELVSWDKSYLPEGEKVLEQLVAMSPARPASYMGGGHMYAMAKEYERADEYYDKAIELYPTWGELYYHKGIVALYQNRIEQAEQYFSQSQELSFNLVTFQNFNIIAGILEDQGHLQLAENYRRRIVEELPKEIDGYLELAKFYYRRGKPDLTYDYLVQTLKLEPKNELAKQLIVELNKTNPKYEIPLQI